MINQKTIQARTIQLPDAPVIPSLTFRKFRGEVDYPAMLAVIEGSKETDGIKRSDTPEDISRNYEHLTNCDPLQDVLMAEINGQVIGYNRVFWEKLDDGTRTYTLFGFRVGVLPGWQFLELPIEAHPYSLDEVWSYHFKIPTSQSGARADIVFIFSEVGCFERPAGFLHLPWRSGMRLTGPRSGTTTDRRRVLCKSGEGPLARLE